MPLASIRSGAFTDRDQIICGSGLNPIQSRSNSVLMWFLHRGPFQCNSCPELHRPDVLMYPFPMKISKIESLIFSQNIRYRISYIVYLIYNHLPETAFISSSILLNTSIVCSNFLIEFVRIYN